MTDTSLTPLAGSSDRNAAVVAGLLGWTLDAFDFFIVTLCSDHIAATFGVNREAITFTIFLTLVMRPVGAFIFGLLADRYGRRRPLMINLVFYSTLSICSGLSRNYHTFVICRALFGIGMGGEWGVGASLAMEKVPPRLRGLLSGLLQEGYAFGGLLASGAYFLIYPRYHHWQPLFWIGGLPALLALFLRFQVKESEVWQKTKQESWGNLGTALISHWRLFLGLVLLMLMMNLSSHGTQDLFPALLKDRFNINRAQSPGQGRGYQCILTVGHDPWRVGGGISLGSDRPTKSDGRVFDPRHIADPVVGLRAELGNAFDRRIPPPVYGARRVGGDPRAHHRIVTRLGPRVYAGLCLSMRCRCVCFSAGYSRTLRQACRS